MIVQRQLEGVAPAPMAARFHTDAYLTDIDQIHGAEGTSTVRASAGSEAGYTNDAEEPLAALQGATDIVPGEPVRTYLHRISQIPLLTAEQEVELAQQIAAGAQAQARLAHAQYDSRQECAGLEREYACGCAARQHLILANLRLVVSIAKNIAVMTFR